MVTSDSDPGTRALECEHGRNLLAALLALPALARADDGTEIPPRPFYDLSWHASFVSVEWGYRPSETAITISNDRSELLGFKARGGSGPYHVNGRPRGPAGGDGKARTTLRLARERLRSATVVAPLGRSKLAGDA